MNHLNDEQFVLYYYGETVEPGVEEHLRACESCRLGYQNLQRVLNSVDSFPVPERAPDYEGHVWNALKHRLGRAAAARWLTWKPLTLAGSVALMVAVAFLSGRAWQKPPVPTNPTDLSQVRERVLLVAVGDHLERSRMVLVELANAGAPATGPLDISYEQQAAEDLLESNRLYRQTAANAGDLATAALLDDLERELLDIAHGPSTVSAVQLDGLRRQIADREILFKVKVFGSRVEQLEVTPPAEKSAKL